ncbi:MAG: radical SAM protein [Eggerthellaceae bacterium]|jgi:MoaA/NifB/PqqE/SkfB family radical SAM enzyme
MRRHKVLENIILNQIGQLRKSENPSLGTLTKIADAVAYKTFPHQMDAIHKHLDNPDDNMYQMMYTFGDTIDENVTNKLVINFLLYAGVLGWKQQAKMREKYQCNIPWTILLDPTSACNLHCKGCWAADYGNRLNLTFEDIDSIIQQGKDLGVYLYIYTGGEPLVRKKDIIELCRKHNDCVFLCFTNGTLIDQEFCDAMLEVGNFVPAISLEGNEETTDFRRGQGTYQKVMGAMKLLHENHLPFGISACYTSENIDAVSSDEFIDKVVSLGASFIWYFHYMPVGSDANLQLMCTPEQREKMYRRSREIRMTKPIFAMDFQNDGQFVQGCIAGGRRYLHINAAGDVDPCVFVHFSDSNIHDMPLLEALRRPLFMAYHDGQPFNDNMLRPCPMLENPEILPRLVKETGAHSSNLEGEETAEMLSNRCKEYAQNWVPTAEKLWAEDHRMGKFYH